MTIRGFETSAAALNITIDDVLGIGSGPFAIDPNSAEESASGAGILCTAGGTRYFIPWVHVRGITQIQGVSSPGASPIPTPPAPIPTPPMGIK